MLLRRPDAEDATQEVLIKAYKALPTFRGECRFCTWLYRIALVRNPVAPAAERRWVAPTSARDVLK